MLSLASLKKQLVNLLIFLFSLSFTSIIASFVLHRASNPYNITNVSNLAFEANYFRVLVLLFMTIAIFFGLLKLRSYGGRLFRCCIIIMATAVVVANVLLPLPKQQIDMFHDGEQLGPALEFKEGKVPYQDLFFLHGEGEDIIMPNIAFAVFSGGKPSLSAYLLMYKVISITTVLLLFILLAITSRHKLTFLLGVLWLSGSIFLYNGLSSGKYIFMYVTMLLFYLYLQKAMRLRWQFLTLGLIGVISSLALLYSIEMGVLLLAVTFVAMIGLLFVKRSAVTIFIVTLPKQLQAAYASFALLAGIIIGQLISLAILGIHNYQTFFQTTFVDIPKYQEQLFNYSLPQFDGSMYSVGTWLPLLLLPLVALLAGVLLSQAFKQRKFESQLLFATLFLIAGIGALRFGVNRPDFFHVATEAIPLFISGFLLIELFVEKAVQKQKKYNDIKQFTWAPILFIALLLWPQSTWNIGTMLVTQESSRQQLSELMHLPSKPDTSWLTSEEKDVTSFIKDNSTSSDKLFVFTAQPLYYYLTNRQNPSRFFITWFADPQQYTNELLASLKKNPPKYIIYSSNTQYDTIDGIKIQDRVPEVDAWIKANYSVHIQKDNTLILSR